MSKYERPTPSTAVAKRSAGCPEGLAITPPTAVPLWGA